ncbi:MAG: protein kinase [Anaerolineaceae bacterium]|nr:MAG: protein kinase [Anaerolineaceae bacterium]
MEDLSGQEIRGYKLIERIGEGGFGVVYRAEQPAVDREVAIKVILPEFADHPEFVQRFEAEARMVAKLEHPYIVPLYDYWRDDEGAFLVMRWLRGGSLREALESGPWEVEAVGQLLEHVADALSMAHEHGVIHRDLKPENILLDEAGNAYLTDFGIAKDVAGEGLTQTGKIVGSADYLAPEQAKGETVTPKIDIYALGVVLYEMLTGEHPFPGLTPIQTLQKHLNEPLPSIRRSRPELPIELNNVVQRATAKDPAERYTDVREMLEACRRVLSPVGEVSVEPHLPTFLEEEEGEREVAPPVFVGREQELAHLDKALQKALAGQGQIVFVTGGVGRGKTALVEEFSRRAQAAHTDLLVAMGNCSAHTGVGDAYLPFRQTLEMIVGDVETRWEAGTISRDQAARLWKNAPHSLNTIAEMGSDLIDIFIPGRTLTQLTQELALKEVAWVYELEEQVDRKSRLGSPTDVNQSNLFEQYSRTMLGVSRKSPLVLVLDDLQWADAASINLLFHLGRRVEEGRILILGAYRPDEVSLGREGERHPLESVINELRRIYGDIELTLTKEDSAEGKEFVDQFLDTEPNRLSPEFRQALFDHTGGHPLFTIELLRALQERGDLIQDDQGRWVEGPALRWDALPARVEAVIEERVGRLEEELREALSVASVEGEDFTAQVVARVQEVKERRLLRELSQELEKRHRLVRDRGELKVNGQLLQRYRFVHQVFQRYLYNDLSPGERRLLHREIAEVLEELFAENADQFAVQLAFHYQRGGVSDKALHYLTQAGHQARIKYANEEAIRYYTEALEFIGENDPERFDLLASRAGVYDLIASREKQLGDVTSMVDLAEILDDETRRCDAQLALVDYHLETDHIGSKVPAERALEISQRLGDRVREGQTLRKLGEFHWYQGDYVEARDHLEMALERFREAGMLGDAAICLHMLSLTLGTLNEFAAALETALEAVATSREAGDRRQEATSLRRLSIAHINQNQYADALPYAEQALVLHRELGDQHEECSALNVLGIIQAWLGQFQESYRSLQQSLSIADATSNSVGIGFAVSNLLLHHYVREGRFEDMFAFLEPLIEKAMSGEDEWLIGFLVRFKGFGYFEIGEYESAIDAFRTSSENMERVGSLNGKLLSLCWMSRVQAALGEYESASEIISQVEEDAKDAGDEENLGNAYIFQAYLILQKGDQENLQGGLNLGERALKIIPKADNFRYDFSLEVVADLCFELGKLDEALSYSREMIEMGEVNPSPYMPERRFFIHSKILRALGQDQDADEYLQRAYARVIHVANNITDKELRKSWLENVRASREILKASAEREIGT